MPCPVEADYRSRIGLAAQGIDPSTGTAVGDYVVRQAPVHGDPDRLIQKSTDLGRRVG